MGQKQSNGRHIYRYALRADVYGIQSHYKYGTSLEWKDEKGRTALIMASKDPNLYEVAKTLIQMGANVNAISKGRHGGTPLHYAAREGLENTVAILLSNGANPFVRNREKQSPLDVARKNGHTHIVRQLESCICLFAGNLREIYGPGLSDVSNRPSSSAVVYVVVVPVRHPNIYSRPELELAIYSNIQDAVPRKVVILRWYRIIAPILDEPVTIFDKETYLLYKFSYVTDNDKHLLRQFHRACVRIHQAMTLRTFQIMYPGATTSTRHYESSHLSSPAWQTPRLASAPMTPNNYVLAHNSPRHDYYPGGHCASVSPTPSAPSTSAAEGVEQPTAANDRRSCVVCFDGPVEGACVPCGHVSTCMSCLMVIKDKKGACPICRAKIDHVVKLYNI